MILLALLALGACFSLLFGGELRQLGRIQIRQAYLVLVALGIQILIFSAWWQQRVILPPLSDALYIASLLLLGVVIWLNRRIAGLAVVGSGLLLNALVIFANGGHMPASLQALTTAGIVDSAEAFDAARITNSSLIQAGTPLWFLGDIFAIPSTLPLANVFSVGDVLIGLGGVWFLARNTRPERQIT